MYALAPLSVEREESDLMTRLRNAIDPFNAEVFQAGEGRGEARVAR